MHISQEQGRALFVIGSAVVMIALVVIPSILILVYQ